MVKPPPGSMIAVVDMQTQEPTAKPRFQVPQPLRDHPDVIVIGSLSVIVGITVAAAARVTHWISAEYLCATNPYSALNSGIFSFLYRSIVLLETRAKFGGFSLPWNRPLLWARQSLSFKTLGACRDWTHTKGENQNLFSY
jgi:hypothetical protein